MFVIKLGGSVITDKTRKRTFLNRQANQLVSEVKESAKKTLIVHGAGSFGHILAKQYELDRGYRNDAQISVLAQVQRDVKNLNLMVLDAFIKTGIPAVSLAPSAFLMHKKGKIRGMDMELFKRYYNLGLTPISFGDVVLDDELKFSICSGDQLMLEFARAFLPEKVIFVTNVDGVYKKDPLKHEDAEFIPRLDRETLAELKREDSDVDDVTGGIFGKMRYMLQIADLGIDTIVINGKKKGRLRDALLGFDVVSTNVVSKKRSFRDD